MSFMFKILRKPITIVIDNNHITMDMYELIEIFAKKISYGYYSLYQRFHKEKNKRQKMILLEKIVKHSRKKKYGTSHGGLPDEYLLEINKDSNIDKNGKVINEKEISSKVCNICPSETYWKKVAAKKVKKY